MTITLLYPIRLSDSNMQSVSATLQPESQPPAPINHEISQPVMDEQATTATPERVHRNPIIPLTPGFMRQELAFYSTVLRVSAAWNRSGFIMGEDGVAVDLQRLQNALMKQRMVLRRARKEERESKERRLARFNPTPRRPSSRCTEVQPEEVWTCPEYQWEVEWVPEPEPEPEDEWARWSLGAEETYW